MVIEMREVIAKVIENALADAISECRAHGDEGGPYPSDYQEAADAVLDALMEPDEGMIEAGEDQLEKCDEDLREENYIAGETPDWDYGMEAEAVWKAMLTAARSGRSGER